MINHPVVILLDTRVGGTSVEVVTKRIYLELFAGTVRECHVSKERNLVSSLEGHPLPETRGWSSLSEGHSPIKQRFVLL